MDQKSIERFWERKIVTETGCWEWTGNRCKPSPSNLRKKEYGRYQERIGKKHKNYGAHRVAWEIVHGKIPDGICVLHECDNPPCINPDHLKLGTHLDNMQDKVKRNRDWSSKFSVEIYIKVKKMGREGKRYREIAMEMKMCVYTVGRLVRGELDKYLPEEYRGDYRSRKSGRNHERGTVEGNS